MPRITINGITITGGRDVSIHNGRVVVDGTDMTPESKEINITITGNVESLHVDACTKISALVTLVS